MAIVMPEKTIISVLASGLDTIKNNPAYLAKVFDEKQVGPEFVQKATEYVTTNKVKIAQGFTVDENRLPGWYVIPAQVSPGEDFIADYVGEDDVKPGATTGAIYEGVYNNFNSRIVTATPNGDATMILEAVARYILLSARETLGEVYDFDEVNVTATDMDPIYQYMPQNLYYRSTVLNFRAFNVWEKDFMIIKDIEIFGKFNGFENDYIEI